MRIECQNISYRYPNAEHPLFNGLSFQITEPGFHALFGPSGVGKTSLAAILTGDITDFSGRVRNKGLPRLLYTYHIERFPDWSVAGRHLEKVTPPTRTALKDMLVDVCGLAPFMGMRFSNLSLGQKNRFNLVRYLVQDFDLLIMDESLANVDEPMREAILLRIKHLFPEKCFCYISHNVSEVARFCRHILVLRPPHKTPQVQMVRGQDCTEDNPPAPADTEKTMLEIMNAA